MRTQYALMLMALCIWREARNQSREGKEAVGWVIRNRAAHPGWWGHSIVSVILKPKQFSCFNKDDIQSTKWPDEGDGSWKDCVDAADAVMVGVATDPTGGADHYYATWMDDRSVPPAWAADYTFLKTIGDHKFYRSN